MHNFVSVTPAELAMPELYRRLVSAIVPRPIALASTVAEDGTPNLAPFSYFNLFSANPPVVVIGPNRSGRTGILKDTGSNAEATREVCINLVSYAMAGQMNLSSANYPPEVSEWEKAGFTPLASQRIKPARVAESPVQLECTVLDVVKLGEAGGAGHLVVCEVVQLHLAAEVLDDTGNVDPTKADLIGRLGGSGYVRVKNGLFEMPKPGNPGQIGWEGLPRWLRNSKILTANDLAALATVSELPNAAAVTAFAEDTRQGWAELHSPEAYHLRARQQLEKGAIEAAWKTLLVGQRNAT